MGRGVCGTPSLRLETACCRPKCVSLGWISEAGADTDTEPMSQLAWLFLSPSPPSALQAPEAFSPQMHFTLDRTLGLPWSNPGRAPGPGNALNKATQKISKGNEKL